MRHELNLPLSEVSLLIDEWIVRERDRKILKRRLLDGICFEPLAEEFSLSVTQIQRIVYKSLEIISEHIPQGGKMS